jgi:tRNA 2-selenouridine synthase
MNPRPPVRPEDRNRFDAIIDARSPAEFALDHIPGAINCPVLDDEERRIVGTLYKQRGAFEARRVGGAMVAANLARHLRERFSDQPAGWRPLVYCWRGGLRSGSMVTWMRLVGWDAQALAGGYRQFRRHVIDQLGMLVPRLDLRVVCGATGTAKTRVLAALAARGAQVIDLEALAAHKGSLLGALPGVGQPAQKAFETRLVDALEHLDLSRPVFIEGEGRRIGRIDLPIVLVERMRDARCVEIFAPEPDRWEHLLRDYAYLGDDREALASQLGLLRELQGKERVERWQRWARDGALRPLFEELARLHYDPAYQRSQPRHFHHWDERHGLHAVSLDAAGIEQLAGQLLSLG